MLLLWVNEVFYEVGDFDHFCGSFWFGLFAAIRDTEEMRSVGSMVEETVEGVVSSSCWRTCVVALWLWLCGCLCCSC